MAVFFSGMSDREVSRLTSACSVPATRSICRTSPREGGQALHLGVWSDKISLIVAPLAAAAGVVVPMMSGRALGHTGGTLDTVGVHPVNSCTNLTAEEFEKQLAELGWRSSDRPDRLRRRRNPQVYALGRCDGDGGNRIPLISSSIRRRRELAEGIDALVLDVKVGSGAFIEEAVGRAAAGAYHGWHRGGAMDKKVQALITDMNQPLGYAVGNALEVMEASQTLQNAGPADLTKLSIELAARMIFLGKKAAHAGRRAPHGGKAPGGLVAYRIETGVAASGGTSTGARQGSKLLPNATGMREIASRAPDT